MSSCAGLVTDLRGSPTAAGQRQAVGAERAGRIESGHALLAFVSLVALAATLASRALQHTPAFQASICDDDTSTPVPHS